MAKEAKKDAHTQRLTNTQTQTHTQRNKQIFPTSNKCVVVSEYMYVQHSGDLLQVLVKQTTQACSLAIHYPITYPGMSLSEVWEGARLLFQSPIRKEFLHIYIKILLFQKRKTILLLCVCSACHRE